MTSAGWVVAELGVATLTALTAAAILAAPPAAVSAGVGDQLTLCHAGSLQSAFAQVEKTFAAQHPGVTMKSVSGGSVALAATLFAATPSTPTLAAGGDPCDVYAAADYLDIDLLLKPAGLADYTIVFAKGRMVLAYLATDPASQGVAAPGAFDAPALVPQAAPDWYRALLEPGVRIGGSHPFLDPSGYRSHMIFQLMQTYYEMPQLATRLLEHYAILPAGGSEAAARPSLGRDYNFQFIYEHSAAAAAKSNASYRYVTLPDRIDLSATKHSSYYAQAAVTIPWAASRSGQSQIALPGARVAWGLTIPKSSRHQETAAAFVSLLLGPAGAAALATNGPAPITPAVVSPGDYRRVPTSIRALVVGSKLLP